MTCAEMHDGKTTADTWHEHVTTRHHGDSSCPILVVSAAVEIICKDARVLIFTATCFSNVAVITFIVYTFLAVPCMRDLRSDSRVACIYSGLRICLGVPERPKFEAKGRDGGGVLVKSSIPMGSAVSRGRKCILDALRAAKARLQSSFHFRVVQKIF